MIQATNQRGAAPASPTTMRRRTVVLGLAAVAAVAFSVLQGGHAAKRAPPAHATFDLKPWLTANTCQASSSDPTDLARRAGQLNQMAQARMQRAVFVTSEALRATSLLAEAQLCAEQAQDTGDANRFREQWLRWKGDITSRFQGHRLRLDLALQAQRGADALVEIKALRNLLAGIGPSAVTDSALGKLWSELEFEQRRITAKAQKK